MIIRIVDDKLNFLFNRRVSNDYYEELFDRGLIFTVVVIFNSGVLHAPAMKFDFEV